MTATSVPLAAICDVNIGRTPSRADRRYWADGTEHWAAISDMTDSGVVDETAEKITTTAVSECGCKQVEAGTILLSFKLSVGKVAVAGVPLFTNEAIAALPIRDQTKAYPRYLFHALKSYRWDRVQADRAAKGLTLNKKKLEELLIPLPDTVEEQRRIAAILDRADAIRRKRQHAINLANDLLRAVFLDMFGDPMVNAKGWAEKRICDVGAAVTGATPPSGRAGMFGGTIPFVTPGDLESDLPASRTLTVAGAASVRTVRAGSTLVCCIGATIGKSGMAAVRSAFNQQINAIEWRDGVNDMFGYHLMRLSRRKVVDAAIKTTLPILKKSAFEALMLPIPPKELQSQYSRICATTMGLSTKLAQSSAEADQLAKSLGQMVLQRGPGVGCNMHLHV